jgi:preprotein translocase subunit YajC
VKRSSVVSELAQLLPLVAIAALFYLLLIRPASRRQRQVREMQSSLSVGDNVMLSAGIYGVVRSLDDDRVRVEIAPGIVVEAARGAVGQRLAPTGSAAGETPGTTTTTDNTGQTGTDADDTTGER